MQVSATRIDAEFPLNPEKYPDSMRPDESARLSLSTLLNGYTMESARQIHWESIMGSLEEGKLANMIIVNKDLFEVPVNEIKDIEDLVIFDGKVIREVYENGF
jgi:predicted amidohydrolase YtcJ